jgi:uncharacterized protein YkwD
MTTSHRLLLIALALVCLSGRQLAAADTKPMLTPEQRKEVQDLLVEFRKARGQSDARLELIDKLADIGLPALNQVEQQVFKDLQRPLADYRQQFARTAAQVFAAQAGMKQAEEVAELRAKAVEASRQEKLTKEQIVEVIDPAIARLKEILLVDRQDVFAKGMNLEKVRDALLEQGAEWDRCQLKRMELAEDHADKSTVVAFADYLKQDEELAIFSVMPLDDVAKQALQANNQLAGRFEAEEVRCMREVNLVRSLLGLNVLTFDPLLGTASRDHSADMQKYNFFSHESSVDGKKTPWDRAKLAGTSAGAENIAAGMNDGVGAFRTWWYSPGHHKNMMGDTNRMGIGRQGTLWTAMFGG